MTNANNRFEDTVIMMLDIDLRLKVNGFVNKGAKWVLCDDGVCLVHRGALVLRVSPGFYCAHVA